MGLSCAAQTTRSSSLLTRDFSSFMRQTHRAPSLRHAFILRSMNCSSRFTDAHSFSTLRPRSTERQRSTTPPSRRSRGCRRRLRRVRCFSKGVGSTCRACPCPMTSEGRVQGDQREARTRRSASHAVQQPRQVDPSSWLPPCPLAPLPHDVLPFCAGIRPGGVTAVVSLPTGIREGGCDAADKCVWR